MQIPINRWGAMVETKRSQLLARAQQNIESLAEAVSQIVDLVRRNGDHALRELTLRFDRVSLEDIPIRVSDREFDEGIGSLSTEIRESLDYAIENVRRFHARQQPPEHVMEETRPGVRAGEMTIPIGSVGLYVPRGRGNFPSMLYMLAVPAAIAGVPRIAIATPPGPDGAIDPACLYAARAAGVDELYRIGGAQAIAAFAFGTESIARVDKIVGPGSAYVAAAKRMVRDVVDVGLPAGPSESMIVADASADPESVSRDLLIEAEHGADSQAILVTTSGALADRVAAMVPDLIGSTPEPRKGFLESVFGAYGGIILAENIEEAAGIVNAFAPEHLQLRLTDPRSFVHLVHNAGEILIGVHAPFSLANYAVGPNAVLPTGGGARVHSGVSVHDFVKRIAVMEITAAGYADVAPHAARLADYEGFYWHGQALKDRTADGAAIRPDSGDHGGIR